MHYILSLVFVLITLASPTVSFAKDFEILRMSDIVEHIDADTLVIFDLDNTLIQPKQMLGSNQWYDFIVGRFLAGGLELNVAIDAALKDWNAVQLKTEVLAVENTTPKIIAAIQAKGNKILGLTARPMDLAAASKAQLQSVGIDLSLTPVSKKDFWLDKPRELLFSSGVLFVGAKSNKGEELVVLLKKLDLKPKRIVFVDDKVSHIKNVGNSVSKTPIEYLGFRYAAADEYVAAFSGKIADIQHFRFRFDGKLLADNEIKELGE